MKDCGRAYILRGDSLQATANLIMPSSNKRMRHLSYDTLGTMKAFFSTIIALAVCLSSVEAGPVRTARHVAKNTVITARNVAHSTVKGTRRAVHTVVNTFTP